MTRRGPRYNVPSRRHGMHGDLDRVLVDDIEHRLRNGESLNQIARATGVAARTVSRHRNRLREGREYSAHPAVCGCAVHRKEAA